MYITYVYVSILSPCILEHMPYTYMVFSFVGAFHGNLSELSNMQQQYMIFGFLGMSSYVDISKISEVTPWYPPPVIIRSFL